MPMGVPQAYAVLLWGCDICFVSRVAPYEALPHDGPRKAFSEPGNNPFDIRLDRCNRHNRYFPRKAIENLDKSAERRENCGTCGRS